MTEVLNGLMIRCWCPNWSTCTHPCQGNDAPKGREAARHLAGWEGSPGVAPCHWEVVEEVVEADLRSRNRASEMKEGYSDSFFVCDTHEAECPLPTPPKHSTP